MRWILNSNHCVSDDDMVLSEQQRYKERQLTSILVSKEERSARFIGPAGDVAHDEVPRGVWTLSQCWEVRRRVGDECRV